MSNDSIIARFHALEPSNYQIVERLEITQSVSDSLSQAQIGLTLVLRPRSVYDKKRLMLTCSGIRDFRILSVSQTLQITSLEVVSISDWQLEGVNYKVGDMEQDNDFSFNCNDFDVLVSDGAI